MTPTDRWLAFRTHGAPPAGCSSASNGPAALYPAEVRTNGTHAYGSIAKQPADKLDRNAPAVIFMLVGIHWQVVRMQDGPVEFERPEGTNPAPWAVHVLNGLLAGAKKAL